MLDGTTRSDVIGGKDVTEPLLGDPRVRPAVVSDLDGLVERWRPAVSDEEVVALTRAHVAGPSPDGGTRSGHAAWLGHRPARWWGS